MKFYFCASARGHNQFGKYYQRICQIASDLEYENIDDLAVSVDPDAFYQGNTDDQVEHYRSTIRNIKAADIVILEVSTHSLSMGYIMQKALDLGKSVVALYTGEHPPYFAAGIENDKLQVIDYDEETLENALEEAFEFAKNHQDTRFNFFISPKQLNYLDKIAREQRTPRSVFLRNLIEKDMAENTEYQEDF